MRAAAERYPRREILCLLMSALLSTAIHSASPGPEARGAGDGAPSPELLRQVDELCEYTREKTRELRPTWTEEEREYSLESMRLAVLSATSEPLSPAMPAALTPRCAASSGMSAHSIRPAPSPSSRATISLGRRPRQESAAQGADTSTSPWTYSRSSRAGSSRTRPRKFTDCW